MTKVTVLVILLFVVTSNIKSSNYSSPIGGRSAAMGNASVTFKDFWSIHNNQAGLARYSHIATGLYYENRFQIKELSLSAGGFVLPTKSGTFGLSLVYFGYSNYNEKKIGLAYGKSFGDKFSMGVQLDYLSTSIAEDYGSSSNFTFEVGVIAELSKNLVLGAHVFNPITVKTEDDMVDRIPAIFKLGLTYKVSEDVLITLETEKNMDYKPLVRGGLEYAIVKEAIIRIGYSSLPAISGVENMSISSLFTFGFGLNLKNLKLDFSSSIHQTLGWSPQISLVYKFNKK